MIPQSGTWMVGCDGSTFTENLVIIDVSIDYPINNQLQLYDTISMRGASKMKSGDRAMVNTGTYKCEDQNCHNTVNMFCNSHLFGAIVCTDENQSCVFDGEGRRRIFHVSGTGIDTMTLKGIRFYRGNPLENEYYSGGGMYIYAGTITLEFCLFDSCSARSGGAIYINDESSLKVYGTNFTNSDASIKSSADIYNNGNLAIFDSCPEGWTGNPQQGASLNVQGALAYGSMNSFTLSSCSVCPLGMDSPDAWHSPTSSLTCQSCLLGKFRSANEVTCTICGVGKYNSDDGTDASLHEECENCPAGKHLVNEVTDVNLHDDSEDCTICKAGKYSQEGAASCADCAKGKFLTNDGTDVNDHDEESDCTECAKGKYNQERGGTSCEACPKGKYLTHTGATSIGECQFCAKGKYNNQVGLGDYCIKCPAGKIAPSPGYSECANCITGTYASSEGLTTCTQCAKDTYSNVEGSPTCLPCQSGKWANFFGAVECQSCSQHMEWNPSKSTCVCKDTFILDGDGKCTCKAGETLINDKCATCEDGRFKDHVGTESCDVCDTDVIEGALETNGTDKTSTASCACGKGKFLDPRNPPSETPDGVCKYCIDEHLVDAKGVYCDEVGLTLATMPLKNGYWRSSKESATIVECENAESCVHSSDDELCVKGHTGPICSVCTEGFNQNAIGVCERCANASVSIGFYTFWFLVGITFSYLILRRIVGKKCFTLADVNEGVTSLTSDDEHWSQRLNAKAKILTSFYQIISKLPDTLAIQFPKIYRTFTTAINSVFNFNAIGLVSVGCFLPRSMYSFYGSLLVTTVTPILFSIILRVVTVIECRKLNAKATRAQTDETREMWSEKAKQLATKRFGVFVGLTYLIFASTTTMAFTTFLCNTYGDDLTEYLVADRSIDCNSPLHQKFKVLSVFMILVYPIGITTFYTFQLIKHRKAIKDAGNRESNMDIKHIVFLWRDYQPDYWWFEIYECFRRLSFTGFLVNFTPGSAPQLCVSVILAFISSLMYSYHQPFDRPDENTLAQVSTISIFLTLLAAIMIKFKDRLVEEHNDEFGVVLVAVNTLIFAIFGLGFLFSPAFRILKKCNQKHFHDAPLKEMGEEVAFEGNGKRGCVSDQLFIDHFKRLVESNVEEAGWTELDVVDWSGGKKKANAWLEKTGAKAEWRCADGKGMINQTRVKYKVDVDIETMATFMSSIKFTHSMAVGTFMYVLDKGEGWRQIYRAIKLPWPLRQRDVVYTEHTRREQGGDILICSRSSKEMNDSTNALSVRFGRIRADMRIAGYHLRDNGDGTTEMTFLADVDFKGSFAIGYLHRRVSQMYMKGVVDAHRNFAGKSKRAAAVSDAPTPLPFLSRAFTTVAKKGGDKGRRLTTSPMFANLHTTPSVANGLNIEMGRIIKKKTRKKGDDDDTNDIIVL
ncbi:hypothetical protein TL16_g07921 [Triparma laevis f. inornata]|uniref:Tyrosine-protein kinase ephrin type A/B receptor-like domain-containing protein n=1 Tax=Triparma laevis f. inornata TaxID=1714386 RepID=A0A9W7ATA4_9STRA|nr:hypothetical protein TL16_g07921 [Triparma laevis f. inornata]